MATEAQIAANRANAKKSTGPRTADGKTKSARNALRFGLFTADNCVSEEDREFYDTFCAELWEDLAPANAIEEIHAAEFIRAAWRLRRCAMADVELGLHSEKIQAKCNSFTGLNTPAKDPMLEPETARRQTSIDRARAQAHYALRRAQSDLTKTQANRTEPAEQNEPNSAVIAQESEADEKTQVIAPSKTAFATAAAASDLQNEANSAQLKPENPADPDAPAAERTLFQLAA